MTTSPGLAITAAFVVEINSQVTTPSPNAMTEVTYQQQQPKLGTQERDLSEDLKCPALGEFPFR